MNIDEFGIAWDYLSDKDDLVEKVVMKWYKKSKSLPPILDKRLVLATEATYRITQSYKLPKWAEKKVVMDWFSGEGIGTELPSELEVLLAQAAKLHEELEKISLVV